MSNSFGAINPPHDACLSILLGKEILDGRVFIDRLVSSQHTASKTSFLNVVGTWKKGKSSPKTKVLHEYFIVFSIISWKIAIIHIFECAPEHCKPKRHATLSKVPYGMLTLSLSFLDLLGHLESKSNPEPIEKETVHNVPERAHPRAVRRWGQSIQRQGVFQPPFDTIVIFGITLSPDVHRWFQDILLHGNFDEYKIPANTLDVGRVSKRCSLVDLRTFKRASFSSSFKSLAINTGNLSHFPKNAYSRVGAYIVHDLGGGGVHCSNWLLESGWSPSGTGRAISTNCIRHEINARTKIGNALHVVIPGKFTGNQKSARGPQASFGNLLRMTAEHSHSKESLPIAQFFLCSNQVLMSKHNLGLSIKAMLFPWRFSSFFLLEMEFMLGVNNRSNIGSDGLTIEFEQQDGWVGLLNSSCYPLLKQGGILSFVTSVS
ncbi:hypothetical protein Tco_0487516 [Tanacetum coccineum]